MEEYQKRIKDFHDKDSWDEKLRLLNRAWGYAQLGMVEDSIKECEALVVRDKKDPHSYVELAYYYEKNGNLERAIDLYKYLMVKFPTYSTAYSNLGHIYQVRKKQPGIAMLCYEKALELNPEDAWALNNIGTVKQNEGRWAEALSYYEKATMAAEAECLEQERLNLILHNLGWAYYRCKDYQNAQRVLEGLTETDKNEPSVFSDLGCVFYKMGKFKKAQISFEVALRLYGYSRYYKRLWSTAQRKCEV